MITSISQVLMTALKKKTEKEPHEQANKWNIAMHE
jgi:hypothetical protein